MTLERFMIQEKMAVGAEGHSFVWHDRVFINEVLARSPWVEVTEGDIICLKRHDHRGTLMRTVGGKK